VGLAGAMITDHGDGRNYPCVARNAKRPGETAGPFQTGFGYALRYLSALALLAAAAALAFTLEISSIRKSRNTAMRFEWRNSSG